MWLFYENPDADFIGMAQKFMDIRKRVYKFPKMGKKRQRWFQFLQLPVQVQKLLHLPLFSDKSKNMKYPLADYELTPDVAIIDPEFVYTVPKASTAFTGLDVLTHAIEAYVSVLANDYTDALALHAIKLVFKYLPTSYATADPEAREKMHNASCIAGMAFTNAFLGVNHSLAHKLGGEFHIPHGLANAYLVCRTLLSIMVTRLLQSSQHGQKYDHYIAPERYAEIAKMMGFVPQNATAQEGVKALADAVRKLMTDVGIPLSIKRSR